MIYRQLTCTRCWVSRLFGAEDSLGIASKMMAHGWLSNGEETLCLECHIAVIRAEVLPTAREIEAEILPAAATIKKELEA